MKTCIYEPVEALAIHSDDDPAIRQTFVFCLKLLHVLKLALSHFCGAWLTSCCHSMSYCKKQKLKNTNKSEISW